jgi:GT2 family glycosyltransferase
MNLSIVIVSWNTKDLLKQCLSSVILAAQQYEHEVFVVDNASSDGSAAMVRSEFPELKLITNASNQGFAAATNQGLRLCIGKYVLLLNPDTIPSQQCLSELVTFAEQNAEVGAIGAKLLNADGSLQGNERGNFPTKQTLFSYAFFLSRLFPRSRFFRGSAVFTDSLHPVEVDWVSGACILLRREAVEEVGLLDERIFMYGEDVELCWRLRRARWKVYYHANAAIVHYGAQSFVKQDTTFLRAKTMGWSCSSGGKPGFSLTERSIIISGLLLRVSIHAFLYIITRQPERKRKCRLIFKMIRNG